MLSELLPGLIQQLLIQQQFNRRHADHLGGDHRTLLPTAGVVAGRGRPAVPRHVLGRRCHPKADRGNNIADLRHIGRSPRGRRKAVGQRFDIGAESLRFLSEILLQFPGKFLLLPGEIRRSHFFQISVHRLGKRTVEEHFMHSRDQKHLVFGFCCQGRRFGDLQHPLVVAFHPFAIDIAYVIPHLGVLRDHVGSLATVGNHIMDPCRRTHMLAHLVDGVVHQLHGIQRTSSVPGVGRPVSCLPEELHLKIVHRQAGIKGGFR